MSDQQKEEIRRKRLERLGQLNVTSGSNSAENLTSHNSLSTTSSQRPTSSPGLFRNGSNDCMKVDLQQHIRSDAAAAYAQTPLDLEREQGKGEETLPLPMEIGEEVGKIVSQMEVDIEADTRHVSRKRNFEITSINLPTEDNLHPNIPSESCTPLTPTTNAVLPVLEVVRIIESVFNVKFDLENSCSSLSVPNIPPVVPASSELLKIWSSSGKGIDVENFVGSLLYELVALHIADFKDPKYLQPGTFPDDDSTDVLTGADTPSLITYWFLDIYERSYEQERMYPKRSGSNQMKELLMHIRQQCTNYIGLVLQEAFCETDAVTSPFLKPLLNQTLPMELLLELTMRYYKNKATFKTVFSPLILGLWHRMREGSILGNRHRMPLMVLQQLCDIRAGDNGTIRPFADLIAHQENFIPSILNKSAGHELGRVGYLSPFFGVSIICEDDIKLAEQFFAEGASSEGLVCKPLQNELEYVRSTMHKVVHSILSNQSTREKCIKFLSEVLNRNSSRTKIQSDRRENITDGPMLNYLSVFQLLSFKVKLTKIDPYYPFSPNCLVDLKNDTRIKSSNKELEIWVSSLQINGHQWIEAKFPTICWFLTLQAHHVCLIPAVNNYQRFIRQSVEIQKMLQELSTTQEQWQNGPNAGRNKRLMKRWKHELKLINMNKSSMAAVILHEDFLKRSLSFYSSVVEYLNAIIMPQTESGWLPELPLPPEVPPLFANLPEWFVEDIADFLLFVQQYSVSTVAESLEDPMVLWLLVMICTTNYVRNPYLAAKLVEVLYVINPNIRGGRTDFLYRKIMTNPIAENHLPSALMKFYTDVESTGASSEFYDKFTIRYHISIIIKTMWDSNPVQRMYE
ncbi:unnamed protein product [Allacma fusca]|uniref:Ubiquitin conjugation factor E4 core domain-containing protein n=1 Tax=Allacma fusca TaxID=39272 RepID=A0A8J2KSZ0_9HEXA|nr:unnamed protein product [Allacma fusca]